MNLIRKIFAALLVSLLVGGTAFAAPLTEAQKARVAQLLAQGASPAEIINALASEGVDVADVESVQEAVSLIVAAVPAADVQAVTQAVTQAVVAVAAADPNATTASVAAIAQAASNGAAAGAVTAAAASGGDVQAAAESAASGASAGAVAAVTASTNTVIAASSSAVANAVSSGAASGATTAAAAASTAAAPVTVNTVAVTTSSNNAASETLAEVETTTETTGGGTEVVVDADTGTEVEIIVPTVVVTSFTIQLSYGSVNVVVTDNSESGPSFDVSAGGTATGTVISSNGGSVNDLILPNIGRADGTQSPLSGITGLLAAIETTISSFPDSVVVSVPGNVITVSPSS